MAYFTSNTHQMKREILTFLRKVSGNLPKPGRTFTADITYGMLASGSCLLTDVVDQLHEDSKKINSVERLTRHLAKGIPAKALRSYLSTIRKWIPNQPVVYIDDSDIMKSDGRKYENQRFSYASLCRKRPKHRPISRFRWSRHKGKFEALGLSGMAPRARTTKMSMKKATM